MAFIAYQLDGADAAKRPVTFAINGGPGASSAWLHLGALGPWRLPMKGPCAIFGADARRQRRNLARFHRSRLHRSAGHGLQQYSGERR